MQLEYARSLFSQLLQQPPARTVFIHKQGSPSGEQAHQPKVRSQLRPSASVTPLSSMPIGQFTAAAASADSTSRCRELLEVHSDQASTRRRLVSADSFMCLLLLCRAALRESNRSRDYKTAQVLFRVSGMYICNTVPRLFKHNENQRRSRSVTESNTSGLSGMEDFSNATSLQDVLLRPTIVAAASVSVPGACMNMLNLHNSMKKTLSSSKEKRIHLQN